MVKKDFAIGKKDKSHRYDLDRSFVSKVAHKIPKDIWNLLL